MLDDFKETQKVAYQTILNAVSKNRLSHAYIIESNNYYRKDEFVIAFAKYLLCKEHHTTYFSTCSVCKRINDGNYSELQIIEPDGQWIKKSQTTDLQNVFSKKAIEGDLKVYVIKEAEKLNLQSANSILKFLEEPEKDIIALIVVDNIHSLIDTIVSRCQVISLVGFDNQYVLRHENTKKHVLELANYFASSNDELESLIIDNKFLNLIDKTISYIEKTNKNASESFIYANEYLRDFTKEDLLLVFDIMIIFYKDVINSIISKEIDVFEGFEELISQISSKNDTIKISNKIKDIIKYKNLLKSNVNIALVVDKLIIDGGKND